MARFKLTRAALPAICAGFLLGLTSRPLVADRPIAPWPPPAGELRVVIDTDAANEMLRRFIPRNAIQNLLTD